MEIIDLSHELKDGSLSYPGTASGVRMERLPIDVPGITVSVLGMFDPHCGTHFDAPLHFVPEADDVASARLVLPELILITSSQNPIPPDVLEGQPRLEGKAVVFSTGWEQHAGTHAYFDGFPVLSKALAEQLVMQNVAVVGVDTPSVDASSGDYPVHRALLRAGIPIIEGLINLPSLIPHAEQGDRVRLSAFPLRIRGLEGSPVRAVALID